MAVAAQPARSAGGVPRGRSTPSKSRATHWRDASRSVGWSPDFCPGTEAGAHAAPGRGLRCPPAPPRSQDGIRGCGVTGGAPPSPTPARGTSQSVWRRRNFRLCRPGESAWRDADRVSGSLEFWCRVDLSATPMQRRSAITLTSWLGHGRPPRRRAVPSGASAGSVARRSKPAVPDRCVRHARMWTSLAALGCGFGCGQQRVVRHIQGLAAMAPAVSDGGDRYLHVGTSECTGVPRYLHGSGRHGTSGQRAISGRPLPASLQPCAEGSSTLPVARPRRLGPAGMSSPSHLGIA